VNPNSYYESLGRPGMRGGERERQLAAFSRNAIVAAEVRPAIKLIRLSTCVRLCRESPSEPSGGFYVASEHMSKWHLWTYIECTVLCQPHASLHINFAGVPFAWSWLTWMRAACKSPRSANMLVCACRPS